MHELWVEVDDVHYPRKFAQIYLEETPYIAVGGEFHINTLRKFLEHMGVAYAEIPIGSAFGPPRVGNNGQYEATGFGQLYEFEGIELIGKSTSYQRGPDSIHLADFNEATGLEIVIGKEPGWAINEI